MTTPFNQEPELNSKTDEYLFGENLLTGQEPDLRWFGSTTLLTLTR